MKSKKLGLFLTLSLVLTGAFAFAQDAPKQEEKKPEESPIKISGVNFSSISMVTGAVPKSTFALNLLPIVNFSIDRLYLKWDHELGKNFSYHVILDVAPDVFTSSGSSVATASNSYVPFVKNAYLRAKGGDDNLFINFDFGIVGTPILNNRNKMADTRWFEDTMHNGHKNIIGMITADPTKIVRGTDGTSSSAGDYDQSADLGLMLEVKFFKMISLTLGASTGEGHANISKDLLPNYAGKAWYGDLFVEPVKGLYVHGFMRYQNIQFYNAMDNFSGGATGEGKDAWFAGAGVGINMMGIRLGADFESGQIIIKKPTDLGGDQARNIFVLNAWLNWNLNEIAGFPMLVVGRLSYGMYNDAYKSYTGGMGVVYDTVYWNAGLGWQFNKNVKLVLLFEMNLYSDAEIYMAGVTGISAAGNPYDTNAMALAKAGIGSNAGWNNTASAIKLKTEVKF